MLLSKALQGQHPLPYSILRKATAPVDSRILKSRPVHLEAIKVLMNFHGYKLSQGSCAARAALGRFSLKAMFREPGMLAPPPSKLSFESGHGSVLVFERGR